MPPLSLRACAPLLAASLLAGCGSLQTSGNFLGFITPYKLEIVQGNVLTKEQAALLQPGMTRAQVKDVLGSPLLADPFHASRWDYVFSIRRQGTEPQLRRVVGRRVGCVGAGAPDDGVGAGLLEPAVGGVQLIRVPDRGRR